ncbi:MAG: hypothetical protein IKP97_05230 [Kiritimatiellae bacterium]|nr:hypothetical protein [Kiritimatiellia bacterium]
MKNFFSIITNNWWLKILALVLAIVIYHALKSDSHPISNRNDRVIFKF